MKKQKNAGSHRRYHQIALNGHKKLVRTFLSRDIQRRIGSVSLLLCLIAIPLVLILSTFLIGVRIRDSELDIDRALSAQVETRLSGFNKALYEEFGMLALTSEDRSETFKNILPESLQNLALQQEAGQPLSDPAVFKSSILGYMQLRLPASLIKTIADQTGIGITAGNSKTPAASASKTAMTSGLPITSSTFMRVPYDSFSGFSTIQQTGLITELLANELLDEFSNKVQSLVWTLLSKAIYQFLDDEIKEALSHYQRFVAECAASGPDKNVIAYPDIFNPSQISRFADIISQSLMLSNNELYRFMAVREYMLGIFWPTGQPSQSISASSSGVRLSGDHLLHRNFSDTPLKQYPGREPGEVEQILTGAKTAKSGISQIKAILVMYRTALFMFRQLSRPDIMADYKLAAAGVVAALGVISGGTIVIEPEIITYVLLACDSLRQGFSDYASLIKGARLSFTDTHGKDPLSLDYVMHLRILLFLTPEKKILERAGALIKKRYAGILNTQIRVSCAYRGRIRNQQGSLLPLGAGT